MFLGGRALGRGFRQRHAALRRQRVIDGHADLRNIVAQCLAVGVQQVPFEDGTGAGEEGEEFVMKHGRYPEGRWNPMRIPPYVVSGRGGATPAVVSRMSSALNFMDLQH